MDTDFLILATASGGPISPTDLLDHLQSLGTGTSRSTLYRRIDALVDLGEVNASEERGPKGRVRRLLSLNKRGVERLKTMAAELLLIEPLRSPSFALELGSAEALQDPTLSEVLRKRMAAAARTLTRTERTLGRLSGEAGFWVRTNQEREIAHMKADVEWMQSMTRRQQRQTTRKSSQLAG